MTEADAIELFSILLLLLFGGVLLVILCPPRFFRLSILGEILELVGNPINSLVDMLRYIFQYLLGWTFVETVKYYFTENSVNYGKFFFVFLVGIPALVIFQAMTTTTIIIIVEVFLEFLLPIILYQLIYAIEFIKSLPVRIGNLKFVQFIRKKLYNNIYRKKINILLGILGFAVLLGIPMSKITLFTILLLFVVRAYLVRRTKILIRRAKRFELGAFRSYKHKRVKEALIKFKIVLKIHNTPLIANNYKFDVERAKILRNMAVILYKLSQPRNALLHYKLALDIYEKPHLVEDLTSINKRIKLFKLIAALLNKLGERHKALEYYQLIYKLTGIPATPQGFLVR